MNKYSIQCLGCGKRLISQSSTRTCLWCGCEMVIEKEKKNRQKELRK